MKAKLLLVVMGLLLVVATTWAWLAPRAVAPVAGQPLAYQWPVSRELEYAVRWQVTRSGPMGAGETRSLSLDGELELDLHVGVLSASPEGYRLRFEVGQVRKHRIDLEGNDALGSGAPELAGTSALVELDRRGVIVSAAFEPQLAEQTREVMQRLLQQMQVTFPGGPGKSWEALEQGLQGPERVRYTRVLDDGRLLARQAIAAAGAPVLPERGGASLRFDEAGVLGGIDDERFIESGGASASSSFQALLAGNEPFDPSRVDLARFSQPAPLAATAAYDWVAHDRRISEGVGWHSLSGEALSFDRGGQLPDGFLASVGAYLRLNPAENARLVSHFRAPGVSTRMRQLVLDYLGAAGDAPAQAAQREALSSTAALENREAYILYVQRLGLLHAPEPATAAFVESAYRKFRAQNDELLASATAVTLGGIVGKLSKAGKPALASSLHGVLVSELQGLLASRPERDQDLRVALVQALGNAALPEDVGLLAPLAASADWALRDQAAYSLRHITTPEARQVLLPLTKDPVPTVAISAVRALTAHPLENDEWQSLAALVATGDSNREADSALARAVGRHQEDAAEHGLAILKAISARVPVRDVDLRSLVDTLIAAQEAVVSG